MERTLFIKDLTHNAAIKNPKLYKDCMGSSGHLQFKKSLRVLNLNILFNITPKELKLSPISFISSLKKGAKKAKCEQ